MSFLYFAYGSNLLPARLTAPTRCPSAKVIGFASARNHTLEITKPIIDQSGKATLIGAADTHTPGVLFEIAKIDLTRLDKAEGAGSGYDLHDEFQVRLGGSDEQVTAKTYLASKTEAHLKPYDWYLALVIAGVEFHELGAAQIQTLRAIEYIIDTNHTRKGRIEALAALREHGVDDHRNIMIAHNPS